MKMEWTQWISMEKLCRRVWSRLIFIARLAAQQPGLFNKASRQQQRAVIENPSDAQRSILMQRLHSQPAALGSFHRLDNAFYLLWHSMLEQKIIRHFRCALEIFWVKNKSCQTLMVQTASNSSVALGSAQAGTSCQHLVQRSTAACNK